MIARSNRPDPPARPLSNWTITAGALVVLGVAAAVIWFVLLGHYGGTQIQLDAIRTSGTLVALVGGAAALLLTARRQRSTELTLVHTTRDATERRITELYIKAADQLGSEKAPVRLAGLHALERLAQNTPDQRQTIVDVICAYLRMPYTPPDEHPPAEDAPAEAHTRYENRRQELQVRLTAQNILFRNLRRGASRRLRWWYPPLEYPAWEVIRLDLTGAHLLEFSLSECQLYSADFTRAQFTGKANFEWAEFDYQSSFVGAQFSGEANFNHARFADFADFKSREADFRGATFTGRAKFERVRFTGKAYFEGATFTGGASFKGAQYSDFEIPPRWALFLWGQSARRFDFRGRRTGLEPGRTDFEGTRVASTAGPGSVWLPGWTTRPAKPDNGEDPAFLYLTKVEEAQPPSI